MGSLYKQGKRVYKWTIQRRDEIKLIIELFNGNLVLPSRKAQFQRFFYLWKNKIEKKKENSYSKAKIFKSTKTPFTRGVTRDEKNMLSLNSLWLLGFVEAEGCFTTSFFSNSRAFRTRFIVSQKGDENISILSSLILLFGVGQIEGHSAKENYSYIVSGLKNVENLYPYFDLHINHFLGIKKESYLNWKSLNEKIKKKEHLDEEKKKFCVEKAKQINQITRKSK